MTTRDTKAPAPFEVVEEDGRFFITCNADMTFYEPANDGAEAIRDCALLNMGYGVGHRAGMWSPRAFWRSGPMAGE